MSYIRPMFTLHTTPTHDVSKTSPGPGAETSPDPDPSADCVRVGRVATKPTGSPREVRGLETKSPVISE